MKDGQDKVFVFYSDKISLKSENDEDFIEGYISTSDIDLVNDIVTDNCMKDMLEQFNERVIKLDFEHETFRGKDDNDSQFNKTRMPLGKAINKEKENNKVKVKWQMNKTWKKFDEKGNVVMTYEDIRKNLKDGYYDAFSIAYLPIRTAKNNIKGTEVRLLDKVNLFNVALTGNPINPGATMTNVMAKSLEWLKNKEGNTMEEDIKKVADEMKAQIEVKSKEISEFKSLFDTEVKDLKSKIESLEKKNAELEKESKEMKSVIEQARQKALGAQNPANDPANTGEFKSTGPLDFIA